jgi:hypothetical protein
MTRSASPPDQSWVISRAPVVGRTLRLAPGDVTPAGRAARAVAGPKCLGTRLAAQL